MHSNHCKDQVQLRFTYKLMTTLRALLILLFGVGMLRVLFVVFFAGWVCCDALPSFTISRCTTNPIQWNTTSTTAANPFILADCSRPAEQQTLVSACYDDSYLHLHFNAVDNNIYSPYTECNQHLYNDGENSLLTVVSYYYHQLTPLNRCS